MTDIATKHTVSAHVRVGADRLLRDKYTLIEGKRVGVLTNHTGRLTDGRSIVDALAYSGLCTLKALYGPEHGIAGDTPDGKTVEHALDPRHGVQAHSLYGRNQKPTPEMLDGIDVVVCDIQDVGARFYTFISTVALAMEAAAEHGIPFVILDRPNPIRGVSYDGPVRVSSLKSFVAWMPIPIMHGLTVGELALLWNDEGWLANGVKVSLQVIEMEGWQRSMWYDETGLAWTPPSPNMKTLTTAIVYPGLCLVEGTSISEGRGTMSPFQIIGAPWAEPEKVLKHLSAYHTPGVVFSAAEFTPNEIPGTAVEPKFEGLLCRGVRISIVDRNAVQPVHLGIAILSAFKRAHPTEAVFRERRFDVLTGNANVRHQLDRGVHPDEICSGWDDELSSFGEIRSRHLMY
ncbi:MAG: DUF1343 domain-containing protein [Ignavibacteria bacterium]|nr:DUF1343 domain-containing protein [Ignavibacteria bacterium]